MKTISIPCNNCGAPLRLDGYTKILDCIYCGSSLKILDTLSSDYVDQLKLKGKEAVQIARKIQGLQAQSELYELENKWEKDKDPLMIKLDNGQSEEPSSSSGLIYFTLGAIVFLGSIILASTLLEMIIFIGGFITSLGFFGQAADHYSKAGEYEKIKLSYEDAREKLILIVEEAQIA